MSDVIIRAATAEDIPAMAALWHEKMTIQQQTDRRFHLLPDGRAVWSQAAAEWLEDPLYTIYVAQRASEIVGYLIGRVEAAPPGLSPARVGAVIGMAVGAHSYQSGLGQRLLAAASDWFMEQGMTHFIARVPRRQPVEQAFWRSLGATELIETLWMKL